MRRRPATVSMTSENHQRRRSDDRVSHVELTWNDPIRLPLASTDLPLLPVAIRVGFLDFPANEAVASGSCQSRLTILVSTGGTLVGTGGISGSVGRNADWAGISGRTRANSSRSAFSSRSDLVNGSWAEPAPIVVSSIGV